MGNRLIHIRAASVGVSIAVVYLSDVMRSKRAEAAILRVGNPIRWQSSVPSLDYVREHGVHQFLTQYKRLKDVESPTFLWGDEVEYGIFKKNKNGNFDLSLRADEVRKELTAKEETEWSHLPKEQRCNWQPEYGSWMIEIVPEAPYLSLIHI